jgi:hypothetical protein
LQRFRLRFLLQEFDLVGPEVILGRSPECHITIEDPLISRRHACIAVRDNRAFVSDLGSRNGVRVNGRPIDGEVELKDGDRVRLGTQELLFSVVSRRDRAARPTGYMRVCHACGTRYPEGSLSCPHCGAPALEEEDTVSGMMAEPRRNWTFQLLGEVIERALSTGRAAEADRLMRRAAKEVDDRLAAGERLDSNHVAMISSFAVRLARLVGGSEWVAWALTLHRRQGRMLADEVIDRLEELDLSAFPDVPRVIGSYVSWYKTQPPPAPSPDLTRLARLEHLLVE